MKAATGSAAGVEGLVPKPAAGKQSDYYLRGDGTWQIPPGTYQHPNANHIPAGGSSGQILR